MILPPSEVREILIYKSPTFIMYEVFFFDAPIYPILEGYKDGIAVHSSIADRVKSYLFEDIDDIDCREALAKWLKSTNLSDVDAMMNIITSWRLTHIVAPSNAYPPAYQGHPIQTEDWVRVPTLIKQTNKIVGKDRFDPLSYIDDYNPTFSLDEFLG